MLTMVRGVRTETNNTAARYTMMVPAETQRARFAARILPSCLRIEETTPTTMVTRKTRNPTVAPRFEPGERPAVCRV